jgi:formylglycine-generating enzyme required for sulfatase activity
MAATRLSESQKQELVARFRGGESLQQLAQLFGCSPTLVSRVAKAAIDLEDYELLLKQMKAADQPPSSSPQPPLRLLRWQARTQVFYEKLGDAENLTMVRIPAGSFQMGSANQELGLYANEGPVHEVTLAEFLIGQTPITQAQWRAVARWTPQQGERWGRELNPEPSSFQGEKARLLAGETNTDGRPVERVSWLEAMEFCSRLSQRTKRNYTLPSEAQWEYACRAGTGTAYCFGDSISTEVVNFKGTDASGLNSLTIPDQQPILSEQTTPVGIFPANAWGLYDMHGNVWEWCLDRVSSSYDEAPCDGSAMVANQMQEDQRKIFRGGSWYLPPRFCRSATRRYYKQDTNNGPYNDVGFRVVCLPPGSKLNSLDNLAAGLQNQIDEPVGLTGEANIIPTSVYFSYSHDDAKWLNKIETILAPLVRGGLKVRSDKQIKPGALWRDEIEAAIADAKVATLLVSSNFLMSDFIIKKELPLLLNAAAKEGLKIVWIPIENCSWEITDIAYYQALCSPARPLVTLEPDELNEALVAIYKAIAAAIENN